MVTEQDLRVAYSEYQEAKEQYGRAHRVYIQDKAALDADVKNALHTGTIEGKNAEMRDAAARQYFSKRFTLLERSGNDVQEYRLQLDLAEIQLNMWRDLLRLDEMLAKGTQ